MICKPPLEVTVCLRFFKRLTFKTLLRFGIGRRAIGAGVFPITVIEMLLCAWEKTFATDALDQVRIIVVCWLRGGHANRLTVDRIFKPHLAYSKTIQEKVF
jgi:hypothetical protein